MSKKEKKPGMPTIDDVQWKGPIGGYNDNGAETKAYVADMGVYRLLKAVGPAHLLDRDDIYILRQKKKGPVLTLSEGVVKMEYIELICSDSKSDFIKQMDEKGYSFQYDEIKNIEIIKESKGIIRNIKP